MKKLLLIVLITATALMADVSLTKCAGCHGVNFEKSALGKSKIVKDLNATQIVGALKGYKAGTYGGSMKGLMKAQVGMYSDTQINEIAKEITDKNTSK